MLEFPEAWLKDQHNKKNLNLGNNYNRINTITVAQVFGEYGGLQGLSPPGNIVLLRGLGAVNPATMAHEVLHKFEDLFDPRIMTAWGAPTGADSSWISQEFRNKCL